MSPETERFKLSLLHNFCSMNDELSKPKKNICFLDAKLGNLCLLIIILCLLISYLFGLRQPVTCEMTPELNLTGVRKRQGSFETLRAVYR